MPKKSAMGKIAKKASVKRAPKKVLAKKPAKKLVAAKPSVKSAAKKPAKKVTVGKKSVPAKASVPVVATKKREKKVINRVPPRIIKKTPPPSQMPITEYKAIDTAKAVAFAMSIASQMKQSAATDDKNREQEKIRLTRRPTTRATGKDTAKFPAADLKEFKKRLIEARERAMNGINAMKATGFNESEDHEADGGDGTNQTLRLQALGQMGNINRTIQQIEEALHRINDGTYGVCTSCGQLIRKPRLMNQPFVLTCMECQNEMEQSSR